jgi:hypothetical protein
MPSFPESLGLNYERKLKIIQKVRLTAERAGPKTDGGAATI